MILRRTRSSGFHRRTTTFRSHFESTIGASELARLTLAKAVTNTAIRWVRFFLPTLALAFDTSTATMAALLGVAETAGLTTYIAGRWLDDGKERAVIILALLGVSVSSALALFGSVWSFAAAAILLGAASAHVTVGGHAWISARAPFQRRARFIGAFETSWAAALLIGAPLVAVLIQAFGWRAPFITLGVLAAVAAVLVATVDDGDVAGGAKQKAPGPDSAPMDLDVWIVISAAAAIAMAGLTTIVITGTWLDDAFSVSTGGIGLVAMAFGAAELVASLSSASFADRFGKRRTTQFGTVAVLLGLLVMTAANSSLVIAAVGLLIFFVGFEYAVVTSFSLVSEALPAARGRAIGIGQAVSTVTRGIGVTSAGLLYQRFGIAGPAVLSTCAAVANLCLLALAGRRRTDLR